MVMEIPLMFTFAGPLLVSSHPLYTLWNIIVKQENSGGAPWRVFGFGGVIIMYVVDGLGG